MLQKVHFRLTSVAQKRCCLSSLMMTAFHFKVVSLHHVRMALNWTFCIKPFKRHVKLTANRVRVNYHFAELIMNTSKLWIPLWAEFSLVQSIFAVIGR